MGRPRDYINRPVNRLAELNAAVRTVEADGSVEQVSAGRIRFILPNSGHSDPTDGVFVVEPAKDALGARIPPLPSDTDNTTGVLRQFVGGRLLVDEVTPPTLGNGVVFFHGLFLAGAAADVFSASAADGLGMGGALDFDSTRGLVPWRWDGTWDTLSATAAADTRTLETVGSWPAGPVQPHGHEPDGGYVSIRGNGQAAAVTSALADMQWWHVYGAYRTGASSGSETLEVDVSTLLLEGDR